MAVVRVVVLWLVALCVLALVPVGARGFSSSVYVANFRSFGAGGVSQYDVGAGGALSPKTPPTVAAGNQPAGIAVSPDGKSVYVINGVTDGAGGVSQYDVGPGGVLSPMATPAVAADKFPSGIAVSPDGKNVYVTNGDADVAHGVSQYDVGPGGALSPKTPPTVAGGDSPDGIAVSSDGKSVYVTNFDSRGTEGVSQYDVGPGGALSPMATPTVTSGGHPARIAVSPDGKSVYVTNNATDGASGVSQYDVGPGGALSPMTPATVATGNRPFGIAISPDGKSVYVTNENTDGAGGVSQYDVAPGGALSPKTPAAVAAGDLPFAIAVSPDGKSVYVANFVPNGAGEVSQYDVGPGGALSPKTPATVAAGTAPEGIVVLPDQGPVAAFSSTAAPPGLPTSFDGSAASDPDGTVASYQWDFGDGSSQSTASATTTHTYAKAGSYTVTLTVTDDAGCSTALVFTGQTASCNGGPQAQTTRQLTIAPGAPGAPSVQIASPVNGARYTRGQVVRARYVCREGTDGPGISSCRGTVGDGQPIHTSAVGRHSFTVSATSKDGQSSTSTVSYTVRLPNNHFTVSHIKSYRNGIITFRVKVPGRGRIDVLETAWTDNLAHPAVLLQPAPHRFVFARKHRTARRAGRLQLRVIPNARGKRLVHHHTYRVTLRLWVSYTPTGGKHRKQGFYGLHLPKRRKSPTRAVRDS